MIEKMNMNITNSSSGRDPSCAVAYVRRSAGGPDALDAQTQEVQGHALRAGLHIAKVYTDNAPFSEDEELPRFRTMVGDVLAADSAVGAILVVDTTRLGRDRARLNALLRELACRGVWVVTTR